MARPRAQDYDEKRQLILRNAAKLFAGFGYVGASITMIAEACGVSKSLLYHYYSDKEAVIYDILATHLGHLVTVTTGAFERAPAGQKLGALCLALLDAYRDADAEHQVQLANFKLLSPANQEKLRLFERRLVKLMSDAVVDAVPELAGTPMLAPSTMSVFGMINWHYLWFHDGKGLTREDYARLVTHFIVSGGRTAPALLAGGAAADGTAPVPKAVRAGRPAAARAGRRAARS
ncbi:TetR/AcrR family transcriptional regulator [Gluconacetobacter sacchari]|uniref:TetR family transcriptional regulator n=2 Tax=Gluconacetobacter sacchari TaxID=92759 RepID=A0A7W4ICS0_9PROT|nr:TetR/AcrR family transcriptional regulator [Gluconacetobacter sacchari]MBB2160478.1 TetR family transcriptional regulator [Gluconacetobacter sacchari]